MTIPRRTTTVLVATGMLLATVAAGVLLLFAAQPALAGGDHDGDGPTESRELALEALSYMANQPGGWEAAVEDKLHDAQEADDTTGVDMKLVVAADEAFDEGDLARSRETLQDSVKPVVGPVTGDDPGTTEVLDPLPGSTTWDGLTWILAGLSAGAVVIGLLLARRWRPEHSLDELRTAIEEGEQR